MRTQGRTELQLIKPRSELAKEQGQGHSTKLQYPERVKDSTKLAEDSSKPAKDSCSKQS